MSGRSPRLPTTAAGRWRWWLGGRAGRWVTLGAQPRLGRLGVRVPTLTPDSDPNPRAPSAGGLGGFIRARNRDVDRTDPADRSESVRSQGGWRCAKGL